MGLLQKPFCAVCGRECGLNHYKIANKEHICSDCFKAAGGIKAFTSDIAINKATAEDIRMMISRQESNANELDAFNETSSVSGYLIIDDVAQKWYIPASGLIKSKPTVHRFDEIMDYELLEDGSSVAKGGLGRAVVGGALFGGAGAIVGSTTRGQKAVCSRLELKITLSDTHKPIEYIYFIKPPAEFKKNSLVYRTSYDSAQKCLSLLQIMCEKVKPASPADQPAQAAVSSADEIMKFKQLLDNDIITKEEFEAKKKQLLGL